MRPCKTDRSCSDELLPASLRQVTLAPAETNSAPAEVKSADSAQLAGKNQLRETDFALAAELLKSVSHSGAEQW